MSNNHASCFNRIHFVFITSYLELPWANEYKTTKFGKTKTHGATYLSSSSEIVSNLENVISGIKFYNKKNYETLKNCVSYIFASLFCKPKRELLWNKEECFLFHFESYFRSWNNQISTFQIFKCHYVIKCPSMSWITWEVHSLEMKFGQFM